MKINIITPNWLSFSCFAPPNSFSADLRAPGPVSMFCAPGLVLCGTKGAESNFSVLRSQTRFGRYRGHQVPFSCFALPDPFSAVSRALGPFFMFCDPELVLGGPKGVEFCALGPVLGGTEGIRFRFRVLRSRSRFGWYRGCRIPFSFSALPYSFSAVPWVFGPVFMFCAPGLVFGGTVSVWSRFDVLRSRTRFGRYRGRRVPFRCFALLNSFWAVLRALGPILIFSALGLVLGGTEGAGSNFHILLSWTCFRRY
jgi:hypothetical protein